MRRGSRARGWTLLASVGAAASVALLAAGAAAQPSGGDDAAQQRDCAAERFGCYRDTDGRWRNANAMYQRQLADREPDYLVAAAENAALIGLGTAWYWLDREHNAADWDYDSWVNRFEKEAFRYDNNDFPMNFVWHGMSGAAYYGLSRANDLSVLGAGSAAFLTSWAWEFLLEFRERISINDQIFTPLAGVALGEFFYKLGRYFNSAPGGGGTKHRALAWSLGLPVAVHDRIDGDERPSHGGATDERGFGSDISARFRLGYGAALARPRGEAAFVAHELQLRGTLVSIPGYLRPGRFRTAFTDADVTSLRLRTAVSREGTGVELSADTMLLGIHHQEIAARKGGLRGGALTLGTSIRYLYRRQSFDGFADRIGSVSLPGLALDGHVLAGPVSLRFGTRVHGEFAAVHSTPFSSWQRAHPDGRAKSILRKQGYYYGWGGSARAHAELRVPYVRLGASVRYGAWRSHEGLDRTQHKVRDDVRARDRALDHEVWVRIVPFDFGGFIEGAYRSQRRHSRLESFEASRRLERYELSIGLVR